MVVHERPGRASKRPRSEYLEAAGSRPVHLRPRTVQLAKPTAAASVPSNAVGGRDDDPHRVQGHASEAHDHRLAVICEILIPQRLLLLPKPQLKGGSRIT